VFRATNRYSVFLLALGLIFLAGRLSQWTRGWRRVWSVSLASGLLAVGLFDQIPAMGTAENVSSAKFNSDRVFGAELEKALPPGAMVFQLPFVEFPEARSTQRLADYEMFRPYLHTSTLRFTYGALKNRARSRWYREYAALPPAELVRKLEANGFSAIYINRRGYADNGDAVLAALAALGRTIRIEESRHQQVVVRLQPNADPVLPLAATPTFGEGWNPPELQANGQVRWAHSSASFSYFNPYPHSLHAQLGLRVSGQGSRNFELALNDRTLIGTTLNAAQRDLPPLAVELRPGLNRFDLNTPEPGVRVSEERSRLRAFALHAMTFRVSSN
jgi:hypothetical protein